MTFQDGLFISTKAKIGMQEFEKRRENVTRTYEFGKSFTCFPLHLGYFLHDWLARPIGVARNRRMEYR